MLHRLGNTTREGWILLAALSLWGCDAAPEARENAPVAGAVAEIDLSVGEMDGAAPYMFGRISGLALGPDGRILVADAQSDEVRVFSPHGEFQFAFGRGGSGPGELRGPCCLAWGPEGALWVRDGGNARYNRYRVGHGAARFEGSVRMAHGDQNFVAPVTFDPQGRLIDIGHQADPATKRLRQVRFHVDSTGAVAAQQSIQAPPPEMLGLHTVTKGDRNQRSTFYLWQPFGPRHLIAHGPGGEWAEAISSESRVRWYGPDGELRREVRLDTGPGPPLSAAERERAGERIAGDRQRFGLGAGELPFGVPGHKPPLRGLAFDQSGRLWVEMSTAEGEARRARIFHLDGKPEGTAWWPAGVELRHIQPGGTALGIARDSLGVERVVRLRFSPAPDGGL